MIETAQTRWEVEGPAAGGLDGRGGFHQLLLWFQVPLWPHTRVYSTDFLTFHFGGLFELWGPFPSIQCGIPQDRSALVGNHTGDLRELAL